MSHNSHNTRALAVIIGFVALVGVSILLYQDSDFQSSQLVDEQGDLVSHEYLVRSSPNAADYLGVDEFDQSVTGEYAYNGDIEYQFGNHVEVKPLPEDRNTVRWVILSNYFTNTFAAEQPRHDTLEKREDASTVEYRMRWIELDEEVIFKFEKPFRDELKMVIRSKDGQVRAKLKKTREIPVR